MLRQACLQMFPKQFLWNITVSLSRRPLNEDFMQALKVIRDSNKALEFSRILLDAKMVIHASESISRREYSLHPPEINSLNKGELDTNLIIYKLKDMIHKNEPKYILVDTVLHALWNRFDNLSDKRHRLTSLLLNFNNYKFLNLKCQNSKECLKHFITDIECFIRCDMDEKLKLFSQTIGALKFLEYMLLSRVFFYTTDLKFIIRNKVNTNPNFSEEVKREFDTLVTDTVSQILTLLSHLDRVSKSVLCPRSSPASDDDVYLERKFLEWTDTCYLILDKVYIYHMTLKEILLKYLNDSTSCNNAYEFCRILSEQGFEHPKEDSLNTDFVICQLKNIIHAEKPKYNLINMVLVSLGNRSGHLKKASELLSHLFSDLDNLDLLKPKYQNSEEYFMHFIQEFEYIINSYGHKTIYTPSERALNVLKTKLYIKMKCKANDLLDTILDVYLSQLNFSEEEKRKFGTLMVDAIAPISKLILTSPRSSILLRIHMLYWRSALQFFKDFFGTFPAAVEIPLKTSDMDTIDECIQDLDESITRWCDCVVMRDLKDFSENEHTSDDEEHDDEEDYDSDEIYDSDEEFLINLDLEEYGASKMPESHTWWTKCSQVLNEFKKNKLKNK